MTDSEILFSDHKATSQSDVYSRTRTFSVDGQPFFAIEKRFKGDPRFDSRYTGEFAELMTVAFTLALLGHENISIHRMDHHHAVDLWSPLRPVTKRLLRSQRSCGDRPHNMQHDHRGRYRPRPQALSSMRTFKRKQALFVRMRDAGIPSYRVKPDRSA